VRKVHVVRKRMAATAAAGVLAGAALVGVPSLALANQSEAGSGQGSEVGQMMSDPEFRDEMTRMMSEMMADPELQGQMRSMMSGMMQDMPGMDHMHEGSMPGMDHMHKGSAPGRDAGSAGDSEAEGSDDQGDTAGS
jgi:tRNA-dihydrouridine synthase